METTVSMDDYDKQVRLPIMDEKTLKGVELGKDQTVTIVGKVIEMRTPREENYGGDSKHWRCGNLVIMVDKITVKGKSEFIDDEED
jgi:hypothetical protein